MGTAKDISNLLAEAASLSQKSAELAAAGRVDEAFEFETRADNIRKRARRAASKRAPGPTMSSSERSLSIGEDRPERGESARAVTIAALSELGVPAPPRAVAEYTFARFGTSVDPRAMASLRRDEMRAWSSPRRARAVYVVPALEGQRFLAARGKVALSDWPLERRIIGPWSERVDHLAATINIARQLGWLSARDPVAAGRVADLVAIYSRTLPGARAAGKAVDGRQVEEAARAELAVIGDDDAAWRRSAADRARRILTEEQLLWGALLPESVQRTG